MAYELSSEDQARLSRIAHESERSEAEVLNEAVHNYFALQEELDRRVERARRDIAEGRTFSHEEVGQMLDKWLAE